MHTKEGFGQGSLIGSWCTCPHHIRSHVSREVWTHTAINCKTILQ